MTGLGLLGGTFNPVHVGHVRLALEVRESLGLERVEFIPAARPPHKQAEGMLPFELRADLLRMALEGLEGLSVNRMEASRPGPSYTCDTLEALRRERPGERFTFIMGLTDLLCLHLWRRGPEIPSMIDLAVAAREGLDGERAAAYLGDHPEMAAAPVGPGLWEAPGGRTIRMVSVPRLDISASFVRDRFRRGACLRYLLPLPVERELAARQDEVLASWG